MVAEMAPDTEDCWIIETSKDGERWRFFGKAWVWPGERLIIHGLPAYVRCRRDGVDEWGPPLERTGPEPMALLILDQGRRQEFWPGEEHEGLPVLLFGGEEGRLLRFEHTADGARWTWALEFRGGRRDS